MLISDSRRIQGQTFNVGYENLTINQISMIVKGIVEIQFPGPDIEIVTTTSDDNRSYHINSDKIMNVLGFRPKLSVEDAVQELCLAFRDNKIPKSLEDDRYFNVKRIARLGVH
jgi:nucleoside-diphosphate-sugar epimerase